MQNHCDLKCKSCYLHCNHVITPNVVDKHKWLENMSWWFYSEVTKWWSKKNYYVTKYSFQILPWPIENIALLIAQTSHPKKLKSYCYTYGRVLYKFLVCNWIFVNDLFRIGYLRSMCIRVCFYIFDFSFSSFLNIFTHTKRVSEHKVLS